MEVFSATYKSYCALSKLGISKTELIQRLIPVSEATRSVRPDYEFITSECWFETKREQCDGCGKDFTYIKVFFPTASMDEFVEVVTPQIYAEWHGGEA